MTAPAVPFPPDTRLGWTDYLPVSRLRADPSGVQAAGTTFQADLLSGMSTLTANVRYVSLFCAARLHRNRAGERDSSVATKLGWQAFPRRFEALIAVASVLHHRPDGEPPLGIVGRNRANALADDQTVVLDLNLRLNAYNIFRGSLSALQVMDIFGSTDQLHDSAIQLTLAMDSRTRHDASIRQQGAPG